MTEVFELRKPEGRWCHLWRSGRGCTAYEARPESCRTFFCFWKAEEWPDDLRPNKCHVLFQALPGVITVLALVDEKNPGAWHKSNVQRAIYRLVKVGRPVIVKSSKETRFFMPKGRARDDSIRDVVKVMNGRASLHN